MIELHDVGKSYGAQCAVDGFSLHIARGEFVALIGASGSGKSTTLRMINRLVERDQGMILFHGHDVRAYPPEDLRRRMGYAIQSTGLFPHWTVARNVATVPRLLGWSAARTRSRVDELLTTLGLAPERFRDRYPHELSGGQMQRVGVARALAADPEVLLMDEPFGALDPALRRTLQQELARIHRETEKTILLVTHDIDEALALATRIAVLDRGRLVQAGTPAQLIEQPANRFVRDYIGGRLYGLRRLGLRQVADCLRAGESAEGEPIPADLSLRDALPLFLERGTDRLPVADAAGRPLGAIHFADLAAPGR